jgi:O-antigen/teichoic acid export membrane protein
MELNSKKRISINVFFSIIQVVIVGLSYLVVYKILLFKLGIEQLGVWSLVLATTSVANLANFGITSGIVKFVAESYSEKQNLKIQKIIFTSLISLFFFFVFISILIYPIATHVLAYAIDPEHYSLAISILPLSLISLILSSMSGVFTSVLEGIQKNYYKNILLILSTLFFLIGVFLLTDRFGLIGVAYSQLIQAFFLLISSYILVALEFKSFLIIRSYWESKIFKEITGFGMKFQLISILVMLFEPITKALLSKFGGLAFLGYYEMANKLIYQVRAVIVNANQVMIPVMVHTLSSGKLELNNIYVKNFNLTYVLSLILISILLIAAPLISIFWIGNINEDFIFCMIVLSTSIFINILSSPAYFACIAMGDLYLLIKSHLLMTIINIVLSCVFGYFFGGKAIVVFSSLSLIISSYYLITIFHKKNQIVRLINNKNILYLVIAIIISSISIISMVFFN